MQPTATSLAALGPQCSCSSTMRSRSAVSCAPLAVQAVDPASGASAEYPTVVAPAGEYIESRDQSVIDPKDVIDPLISEQVARELMHGLIDIDDHLPIRSGGEAEWLDVRIDQRPLARSRATYAF